MCFEATAMSKEDFFVSVYIQLKSSDPSVAACQHAKTTGKAGKAWACSTDSGAKRDAENPILNTLCKSTSEISKHSRDQEVSAYNRSFLTIIQSHGCKEILFSLLHAKKIAYTILLYVLTKGSQLPSVRKNIKTQISCLILTD